MATNVRAQHHPRSIRCRTPPDADRDYTLPLSAAVTANLADTVKNLQFALTVEPENVDAQNKILWAQDERAAGRYTVPSTIGDELSYNPCASLAISREM